jgi:hypothetical protein
MSEQVRWMIEGRVISISYEGFVSLDTVKANAAAMIEKMNTEGQPPFVHNISIMKDVSLDRSAMNLVEVNRVIRTLMSHPSLGWIVTVGPNINPMVQAFGRIITQVAGVRYRHCASVEEALQFLNEQDSTLVGLPVNVPQD